MLLMQLAVPELRYGPAQRNFNSDLAASNFDLNDWRCACLQHCSQVLLAVLCPSPVHSLPSHACCCVTPHQPSELGISA